ncbi:hypothetical protein M0811_14123 [Anaeramoeba ignava]|uniref:Uncharacterized protein n=1 Tax=Anaeramoeba ignava TaxID=1746090 RepID=A0A9Q0LUA9_ANAIG|nr:hypothetical protein M0811_14123 [Anaeramoeba ignava]
MNLNCSLIQFFLNPKIFSILSQNQQKYLQNLNENDLISLNDLNSIFLDPLNQIDKEFFNPFISFILENLNKFNFELNETTSDFFEILFQILYKNISNSNTSSKQIARSLGISSKEIEDETMNQLLETKPQIINENFLKSIDSKKFQILSNNLFSKPKFMDILSVNPKSTALFPEFFNYRKTSPEYFIDFISSDPHLIKKQMENLSDLFGEFFDNWNSKESEKKIKTRRIFAVFGSTFNSIYSQSYSFA